MRTTPLCFTVLFVGNHRGDDVNFGFPCPPYFSSDFVTVVGPVTVVLGDLDRGEFERDNDPV